MDKTSDYPEGVWEYADRVSRRAGIVNGSTTETIGGHQAGLGC